MLKPKKRRSEERRFIGFVWILERNLERSAANLHEVHALRAGVHLLYQAEAACGADDLAHVVVDGDRQALCAGNFDVVVSSPVDGNCSESCRVGRKCGGRRRLRVPRSRAPRAAGEVAIKRAQCQACLIIAERERFQRS